jgi:Ca-activated chloride channel family protein
MKWHSSGVAALSTAFALALSGCSAGGPTESKTAPTGGSTAPVQVVNPAIQVLPATYDFGKVTSNNRPAPLEVTIGNGGNAPLLVSGLSLPADAAFSLRLDGGSRPCRSGSPTIAAGDLCTVEIAFHPGSTGAFATTLRIPSNDRASPLAVPIAGTSEPVATLTVRINQLQSSCPADEVTAYVTVTDQGGYPVPGLLAPAFTVTHDGISRPVISLSYIELAYKPIASAATLDFSNSMTSQSIAFADMKQGFAEYFGAMRTQDVAAVVKFGSEVEVTQAFTSDKTKPIEALSAPFDKGSATKLHDAAFQAIDDAGLQSNYRRAVIVATDGADNASVRSLADVTSNALNKSVPIFAIGIGAAINRTMLEQLAAGTGGLYFEANTSQNLATIYRQISSILYEKQYVLRFDRLPNGAGASGSSLTVGVSALGLTGSGATALASCN